MQGLSHAPAIGASVFESDHGAIRETQSPRTGTLLKAIKRNQRELKIGAVVCGVGLPFLGFAYVSVRLNAAYLMGLAQSEDDKLTWWLLAVCISVMAAGVMIVLEIAARKSPQLQLPIWIVWGVMTLMIFSCAMGASADVRGGAAAKNEADIKQRQVIEDRMTRTNDRLNATTDAQSSRSR